MPDEPKNERAAEVARGCRYAPGQAVVVECQLALWRAPDQELLAIARSQICT
jgi:hypothetical protein